MRIAIVLIVLLSTLKVSADQDQLEQFTAICAIYHDNKQFDEAGNWKTPDIYYVNIPLEVSGDEMTPTFGTLVHYNGVDGRLHECGYQYDYAVLRLAENWKIEIPRRDKRINHLFTQDNNKLFWDWYYRGYHAPEQCDYSQNCHGFAFSVGDWPDSAAGIIKWRDPSQFVPKGAPQHDPCFEVCQTHQAEIATNISGHSIQVIGKKCASGESKTEFDLSHQELATEHISDEDRGHVDNGVIVFSAEQFRESGTYLRIVDCPDSLDVTLAHDRAGDLLRAFGRFKSWDFYKRKD